MRLKNKLDRTIRTGNCFYFFLTFIQLLKLRGSTNTQKTCSQCHCAETQFSDTLRLLVTAGDSKSFSSKLRAPNSQSYGVLTETLCKQDPITVVTHVRAPCVLNTFCPFAKFQHSSCSITTAVMRGRYNDTLQYNNSCYEGQVQRHSAQETRRSIASSVTQCASLCVL
jgi:hypothetical protein